MKKILLVATALLLVGAGALIWLKQRAKPATVAAVVLTSAKSKSAADSSLLITKGLVGAGGNVPLLARTAGRVKSVFFSAGDYARQGQILAKLTNQTFITAPKAGFLGPCEVAVGQYISAKTPFTTLSNYSYLVVSVLLPRNWEGGVFAGDSVQVSVAGPSSRMATGVLGALGQPGTAGTPVEIIMTSRAPFHIGEQASVSLHDKRLVLANK